MNYNVLMFTNNDCYKANQKMTPKGIVVHSTGANNPWLKRYVAPNDGKIGENSYGNHWNKAGVSTCPHAFIGKLNDGSVATYQVLPLDICCWGCGSGSKGSYNYDPAYLQFEICEDNLTTWEYWDKAMKEAIALCAKWCKEFGIPVENVVSHKEARLNGYASNHSDIDHWLAKWKDRNMGWFRAEVKKALEELKEVPEEEIEEQPKEEPKAKNEGDTDEIKESLISLSEAINKFAKLL